MVSIGEEGLEDPSSMQATQVLGSFSPTWVRSMYPRSDNLPRTRLTVATDVLVRNASMGFETLMPSLPASQISAKTMSSFPDRSSSRIIQELMVMLIRAHLPGYTCMAKRPRRA